MERNIVICGRFLHLNETWMKWLIVDSCKCFWFFETISAARFQRYANCTWISFAMNFCLFNSLILLSTFTPYVNRRRNIFSEFIWSLWWPTNFMEWQFIFKHLLNLEITEFSGIQNLDKVLCFANNFKIFQSTQAVFLSMEFKIVVELSLNQWNQNICLSKLIFEIEMPKIVWTFNCMQNT